MAMTDAADYELPGSVRPGNGQPEPVPVPTPWAGGPRPQVESLTVSLRRSYWTTSPRGSYEVTLAASFAPDRAHSTPQNLDAVHAALARRLDSYLGSPEEPHTPNGGKH